MNQHILQSLQIVLQNWKGRTKFIYENKSTRILGFDPIQAGELVLRFSVEWLGLTCQNNPITVTMESGAFVTTLLSSNSLAQNNNADAIRLESFLANFDTAFYNYAFQQMDGCVDHLEDIAFLFS
jgi:hypothetical protein